MTENYEHYISRNIKAFYKRRLFSPIIFVIMLIILWFVFPLYDILNPVSMKKNTSLADTFNSGHKYIKTTLDNLHFTGYTEEAFGSTKGYFYYCIEGDNCYIVLLDPSTCEEGVPTIEKLTLKGKIISGKETYAELINNLSVDLHWTEKGLRNKISNFYLSEPDFHRIPNTILFIIYFGTAAFALISIIVYIIFIIFPFLSPTCQNLIVFGHPRQMLEQAEEELATLPQLATEDMFITEHYFILTSPYGNAIVPIQEILWIYKYSTLKKFLWYHFSISYTLYISANKHLYIHCPKNTKSDIDGIIDYLSEANHNILVGFNEENRLKVQAIQGKPLHIERLYALMRRKV